MLSKVEILERLALGEDAGVEFKQQLARRQSEREQLAQEICAFANARGGVILVGIDDSGNVIGLSDISSSETIAVEIANDSIKPAVHILTEKLYLEGKAVLQIEVPRSLFVHKAPGGYFIRQGSSKREMTTEQLTRLLQSRSQAQVIRFDEQPIARSGQATLSRELYMRFINENAEKEIDRLRKRRLLIKTDDRYEVSVAAMLMCHPAPEQDYLPGAYIQSVYYSGRTKDANYQIDAKNHTGPLDQQIVAAFQFVRQYNRVSARKNIGREDHPQYSMRAVFEAIVNAVVHRDYSIYGGHIRLFMFADRLELYSPGALANTLTVDTLPYNQVTRNELLARLLSEIPIPDNVTDAVARGSFLERRGEGVGIILRASEQLSGRLPQYELLGEELRLTIYAASKSVSEL